MPSAFDCHDTVSGFDCKIRINSHDVYGASTTANTSGDVFRILQQGTSYPPSSGPKSILTGIMRCGQIGYPLSFTYYYGDVRGFATFSTPSGTISTARLYFTGATIYDTGDAVVVYKRGPPTITTGDWTGDISGFLGSGSFSGLTVTGSNYISLDSSILTGGATLYLFIVSRKEYFDEGPPTTPPIFPGTASNECVEAFPSNLILQTS